MVVIGIDPGYAITGYSVLDYNLNKITLINYGSITTHTKMGIGERINLICTDIKKLIKKYKPISAGIEKVYFSKNKKTALNIAEVRGALIYLFYENGISVYNYTPLQVKKSIVGYGKADKKQIQRMIQLMLDLKEIPAPDDVADAIAIGICHINFLKFNSVIEKSS